jgi:hypothetical protein
VFDGYVAYVEGDDGIVYALNAIFWRNSGPFAERQFHFSRSRQWGPLLSQCRQPVRV